MNLRDDRFYVTGGTLPTNASSYVVRQADTVLYQGLQEGEFCYVLNTRQMGKSSLMVRTAQKLRGVGTRVTVLDLTSIGQTLTPEQWYYGLLCRMGEQLDLYDELAAYWRQHPERGPLQRWIDAIRDVILSEPGDTAKIVIFLDEIDAVRSLPFSTDEFFAGIRECYNRRSLDPLFYRLTFCLLGVATPADLIRESRMSPFNIGHRILLTDFSGADASALAHGLTPHPGADAQQLLDRVLFWTSGHPYMTQRLCQAIAQHGPSGPEDVDRICAAMFLSRNALETDDNLAFVRNRLLQSGADLATLLDLYVQIRRGRRIRDDETNPLCSVLRLSGVVRSEQGLLQARNRIYDHVFNADWVQARMPDAEVRRQRRAYRLGLLRAAGVAAGVVGAMAILAVTAITQAVAARQARDAAQRNLQEASRQRDRVNRLNSQLQAALHERERINAILQRALMAEKGQRRRADEQRHAADLARHDAETRRTEAETARGKAIRQEGLAVERLSRLHVSSGIQAMNAGDLLGALPSFVEATRLERNPDHAVAHRARIASVLQQSPQIARMWFARGPMTCAAFSPNGQRVVTCGLDGVARVWDVATGRAVTAELHHAGAIYYAAFNPDGRLLVTCGDDHRARLWDANSGALLRTLPHPEPVVFACWSADGRRIATACKSYCYIWDATVRDNHPAPIVTHNLDGAHIAAVAFSPDGSRISVVSSGFLGWILDSRGKDEGIRIGQTLETKCYQGDSVEYSADGKRLLVAGTFGSVGQHKGAALFDTATGVPIAFLEHAQLGTDAHFSPDGTRVVTASDDGTARVWDAASGKPVTPPLTHRPRLISARFSPDGAMVVTACTDGTVQMWDAATGAALHPPLRHAGPVVMAGFDLTGRRVLTVGNDHTARLWALPRGNVSHPLLTNLDNLRMAQTCLGGSRAALMPMTRKPAGTWSTRCELWDLEKGHLLCGLPGAPVEHPDCSLGGDERQVAFCNGREARVFDTRSGDPLTPRLSAHRAILSPNGRYLAFWFAGQPLHILDIRTGTTVTQPLVRLPVEDGTFCFRPDSRAVAARVGNVTARLLDCATGGSIGLPLKAQSEIVSLHFCPDGRYLFTPIRTGEVLLWDTRTGKLACPAVQQGDWTPYTKTVLFSPNGRYALTVNSVNALGSTLWDLKAVRPVRRIALFGSSYSHYAQFSKDSRRLIHAGQHPRVWDCATGLPLTPVLPHNADVNTVASNPDGSRIVTACADGSARIWDARRGASLTPRLLHLRGVNSAYFSPDGRYIATGSEDGTARIWDACTGEAITPPLNQRDAVQDVSFVDRGRRLLVIGAHSVALWDIPVDDRPLSALVGLSNLLSGQQIISGTDSREVAPGTLSADWQALHQ